jgi:hypothetical protein
MKTFRLLLAVAICFSMVIVLFAQEESPEAIPPAVDTPASEVVAPTATDELPVEQARLADRFKRLEEVLGRLAELSASTDPRRAKLLRDAIAQSREQDVNVRFESIVKLLEDERLSAAATNQTELQTELDQLLTLLLKADRDKELSSQRDRVRKYLKEVARLIRMQKDVRARTEGGDDFKPLSKDQERVAADTGQLGGDISTTEAKDDPNAEGGEAKDKPSGSGEKADDEKSDGEKTEDSESKSGKPGDDSKLGGDSRSEKPSDSAPSKGQQSQPSEGQPSSPSQPSDSPPSQPGQSPDQPGQPSQGQNSSGDQPPPQPQEPADRAAQRLRDAQQQMEQARQELDDAQRKGAANKQREALRALEQAKAELERILRQIREEELERTLTQLVARFKKMLEWQIAVHEGTVRVDNVPQAERDHDDEIEAARLSRQEAQILHEADKALLLLREEGSSVAFPETVEQMRDDVRKVVAWLAEVKVGKMTQSFELDIIAALEETIAALEKAIKDLEKKRTPPGQQPSAGQPTEPPLVDKLSELKMIRALQMRINKRTQRFGEMIEGEQAETAELIEALEELARRQERVHKATADLEQGRND